MWVLLITVLVFFMARVNGLWADTSSSLCLCRLHLRGRGLVISVLGFVLLASGGTSALASRETRQIDTLRSALPTTLGAQASGPSLLGRALPASAVEPGSNARATLVTKSSTPLFHHAYDYDESVSRDAQWPPIANAPATTTSEYEGAGPARAIRSESHKYDSRSIPTTPPELIATNSLSAADEIQNAATGAQKAVGPGKGPVYGTKVHTEFANQLKALGRTDIATEVSYLNGVEVPYGTPGSVRLDAVVGSPSAPTAIYDLKTGSAALTPARIAQIRANLPPSARNIPVLEVWP